MRTYLLLLAIALGVARSAHPQTPTETPEQVANRFVDAMRASDWNGMAALMHADALREMRGLFTPLIEAPDAGPLRQQLLGVGTVDEAKQLSDTAVFAALMRTLMQQEAGLAEVLRTATVQMIGHIDEGADTTHVVYRMAMTIEGIALTQMDVMSLSRSPVGWRGLLKGDVSALAAGIRAAIEGR
ncbi:MAG: hypothetical protein ACREMN_13855 [Gemmatimonadales bacterium]